MRFFLRLEKVEGKEKGVQGEEEKKERKATEKLGSY